MTRDDIIRMAREAGFAHSWSEAAGEALERFAALAAAAERERIIAKNAPEIEKINTHIKALENAVAAEREACAKVCEVMTPTDADGFCPVAAAIRARNER